MKLSINMHEYANEKCPNSENTCYLSRNLSDKTCLGVTMATEILLIVNVMNPGLDGNRFLEPLVNLHYGPRLVPI